MDRDRNRGNPPPDGPASLIGEGWYLMSVRDLEIELARRRDPSRRKQRSNARSLNVEEALAYRDAGNLPDELDRTLRLVLILDNEPLSDKRLRYEPDFHATPAWRRTGSRPVNVVPLAIDPSRLPTSGDLPWWQQPDVAPLEEEWQQSGAVGGIRLPGPYRSFVLKTIASLRSAGIEVTQASILSSVSRWLQPDQVVELREAFEKMER